ncbi:MAG: hypothetical protein WCK58_10390 [Chloroflexota bacterium]
MSGRPGRLLRLIVLGWLAFVAAAIAYATLLRRRAVVEDEDADEIDLVVVFAPLDFASEAGAFRGGRIATWFGGGTLDLRRATLAPGGALLRVQAVFGGGLLVVPAGWRVETRLLGLGGAGDDRDDGNPPVGAPTLRLEGVAAFGGWGISSEKPGESPVSV